jgi:hypothetical protein
VKPLWPRSGCRARTFYAWYKRYLEAGVEALEDRKPRPRAVWNRIPERIRAQVIETALLHTQLSARELACRITDREGQFLSESSVYRILKAADLIESPVYLLLQATDRFPCRDQGEPDRFWVGEDGVEHTRGARNWCRFVGDLWDGDLDRASGTWFEHGALLRFDGTILGANVSATGHYTGEGTRIDGVRSWFWLLRRAIEANQQQRARTARQLGITREGLYKKRPTLTGIARALRHRGLARLAP